MRAYTIPTADVLWADGKSARVLCPLCGDTHDHIADRGNHWRAAPCGLYRNRDQRLGYRFTIKPRERRNQAA